MSKSHNTPDHDEAPPPPYAESDNTAYNPAFMNSPSAQHHTQLHSPAHSSVGTSVVDSSNPVSPTAPPLVSAPQQQQPQPPHEHSSSGLYPAVPPSPDPQYYQQFQQQQQYQYYQQQYYQQQQQLQHQNIPSEQQPVQQQQPQRYHYQSINVPTHHQYYRGGSVVRRRVMVDSSERGFPIAALFFLFGWFCPPFWVLGACCCSGSRNRYESWWGKANFIMAVMFIISSIVYSMIAITMGDWMVGLRLLNFSVE